MTVRFRLIPNVPKELFHVEAGKVARERVLDDLGQEAKELFQKTTETWNHNVVFVLTTNKDGRAVSTRGEEGQIYTYIDGGTRVRHAVMTPDFKPKTFVGKLYSAPGQGGMAFVSKKLNLPGIKARGFSETIQKKMDAKFKREYKKVFDAIIHG